MHILLLIWHIIELLHIAYGLWQVFNYFKSR